MNESLQIVRPLHSFESAPPYLPIVEMLMPTYCHVAYQARRPEELDERMQRVWATRRKMSGQQRAEIMLLIQPMLDEGKSSQAISAALGVSRTSVDRYIRRNGLERPVLQHPSRKIFNENEAEIRALVEEIGVPKTAAKFGISFHGLYRFLEK